MERRTLLTLTLLLAAGLVLAPAPSVLSEPTFYSFSATDAAASHAFAKNTLAVTIVNDGPSTAYFRLFTDVDTAGAATTNYLPIKIHEGLPFSFFTARSPSPDFPQGVHDSQGFNATTGKRASYWKSISVICAGGETAVLRIYSQ